MSSNAGATRLLLVVAVVCLGVGFGAAFLLRGSSGTEATETPATTADLTRDGDPDAGADLPEPDALGDPAEATDAEAALRGFLAAEVAGEWEASYAYLTEDLTTTAWTSAASWVASHANFPSINAYRVDEVVVDEEAGVATAQTLTGYDPVVDPVLGLVAARGRTDWMLEQDEAGLWRVIYPSVIQPLYPSSEGADGTARAWVDARAACEETTDLEVSLIGTRSLAQALCDEDQPEQIEIAEISSLADTAETAALLSEFGPEVFGWARTVVVEAATPFTVVLGPVGEEWRVVAVLNQS